MRTRRAALALVTLPLLALVACSGDEPPAVSEEATPAEVMALAKKTLDETSGVRLDLRTDEVPAGVSGVSAATGVGTHDPAFDGTLTVVLAGQAFDVPVIAVDGTVFAQVPLTPGWQDVDPADYAAPDPLQLMSTDAGLSSLLTQTTELEEGESVRGGENNDEILTEYTGTLPSSVVTNVIPSASGDFDATYTVTDGGELRTVALTGVFYPDTDPITYTIGFDDYGIKPDITAP